MINTRLKTITCASARRRWPAIVAICCPNCHGMLQDDMLEYESTEGHRVSVCCEVGLALEANGVVRS
jgi:hypothetical protein